MKTLKKPAAVLLLVAVTVIWGSGFTIVKSLMNAGLSAGAINIFRGYGLALLIFAIFAKKIVHMKKRDALIGIVAGVFNSLGFIFQSVGLQFTTPSTSAFLTVLNTVLVPILALVFYKVKPGTRLLPAVLLALVGTFFLTGMSFDNFRLGTGEWLTLAAALCYAALIVFLGNTGTSVPTEVTAFWMGFMQGFGAMIYFLIFERTGSYTRIDWVPLILPILYLIVLGSLFTTFAQVASQKTLDASTAAMVMTLEAVFGTIISLIFGFDRFGWRLMVGGLLILAGVVLVLLPADEKGRIRFGKKPPVEPPAAKQASASAEQASDSVDNKI